MLPAQLADIKAALEKKGYSRSKTEDQLFAELQEVDKALDAARRKDESLVRNIEKYAARGGSYMGPSSGSCPTCGRPM